MFIIVFAVCTLVRVGSELSLACLKVGCIQLTAFDSYVGGRLGSCLLEQGEGGGCD